MPVRKFRSVADASKSPVRLRPGTKEHSLALRAVFSIAAQLSSPRRFPPGVYRYRSVGDAQAQRSRWARGQD
jgi:hypothetical protein